MENLAIRYSLTCKAVKKAASKMVVNIAMMVLLNSPFSIQWWAQVTEIPEETNTIVFKNGIPLGFSGSILTGGHNIASSVAGLTPRWM